MVIENLTKVVALSLMKKGIEDYNNIAKKIVAYTLKVDNNYLVVHNNKEVSKKDELKCIKYVRKIIKGEPVQYVVKNQSFMGLDFYVNKNVLIPQPDTETLVVEALNILERRKKQSILDLCTGSGVIAISLAKYKPNNNYCASDISYKALRVAKKNAVNHNVKIKFINCNMFNNIYNKFNIIISNPPYIKKGDMSSLPDDVKKEPALALCGGEDGLKYYKIIAKQAKKYLTKNGILMLEIGYNQKEDVTKLLKENGYKNIKCIKDLAKNDRVIIGEV